MYYNYHILLVLSRVKTQVRHNMQTMFVYMHHRQLTPEIQIHSSHSAMQSVIHGYMYNNYTLLTFIFNNTPANTIMDEFACIDYVHIHLLLLL